MSGLIAFHAIAAARGDGLLPELRDLLEYREARQADPAIVELSAIREDRMMQAGPSPARRDPLFLPGNVVRFGPAAIARANAATKASKG